MDIRTVEHNGKVLVHFFFHTIHADGVRFLTPDSYTLQLGLLEHQAGKIVRDHIHNPEVTYKVDTTQEFLYLEKGKVKVKIFTDDFELVEEVILEPGDFLLHVSGGHGFEVLEPCRMIEIKQGPFPGKDNVNVKKYRD